MNPMSITRLYGHTRVKVCEPVSNEELQDIALMCIEIDLQTRARKRAANIRAAQAEYWANHEERRQA